MASTWSPSILAEGGTTARCKKSTSRGTLSCVPFYWVIPWSTPSSPFLWQTSRRHRGSALSAFSIVVFGGIIPRRRARHGLYIGANTVWLVKIFMCSCTWSRGPSPCYSIACSGATSTISADELHKLIRIRVENTARWGIRPEQGQGNLLTGALEYKDKKVSDVMTLDKVFMIESSPGSPSGC